MAASTSKKRKIEASAKEKPSHPTKKPRPQPRSTSSSPALPADEFNLASPTSPASPRATRSPTPSASSASSSSAFSEHSSATPSSTSATTPGRQQQQQQRRPRKRNDPAAFSTSITKILSSKLSVSKRGDPVLARSATAALAHADFATAKLEARARQKLRADRKLELDRGRVRDVVLGTDYYAYPPSGGEQLGQEEGGGGGGGGGGGAGEMLEMERRLRKTAQRGVVKLFNAVRAAQVKGEEAARKGGAAGRKRERVGEMSKKGFLELVAGGGLTAKEKGPVVEEA